MITCTKKILFSASNSFNALSPLDGRYFKATSDLNQYFSEAALMKYRIKV
jgi:adenylosuccinate lyase